MYSELDNTIVVDDGPGASRAIRKEPEKLSTGKKYSTQTTSDILMLHGSE